MDIFRKMKYNLDTNKDIYHYIISEEYKPADGMPEIPYKLVQPGRIKTKKPRYKWKIDKESRQ